MTIGKKLKKAREDASLTQQQLSLGIVTRNMLSQIENDRAKPSLDTLALFAERLGIKMSYFLCDDDDNFAIMKESVLSKLRARMKKREYNDCLDLLYRVDIGNDDELRYISCLCHYYSALDDYRCGRLKSAKESFLSAISDANLTVYPADTLKNCAKCYVDFISSLTVTKGGIKSAGFVNLSASSPDTAELWYVNMLSEIDSNNESLVLTQIERLPSSSLHSAHIKAKLMMKSAPDEALMKLLSIYHEDIGAIMRYSVLCDLESIYLMKNDYEKALDCSDEKQKMLSKIK